MTVPTLHIRLFGGFNLSYHGQQVRCLNTTRLRSLLAYLLLHREVPQQRQHLAFLFWPDATEAQARNNLRQLLHLLRQGFPDIEQFLVVDAHLLYWRPLMPYSLDIAEFEQALTLVDLALQGHDRRSLQDALEKADSLYSGEFFPDCYEEWIFPERERFRQDHQRVLERLLHHFEEQGDYVTAIRYAQRLLARDPLSEDLSRHLMRLFMLNNDRASALRVYNTCVTTLQHELGIEPDRATREAYKRLTQHEVAVHSERTYSPVAVTPALVGRRREWKALQKAWQTASVAEPHFVLVTGEAGMGKSRLAEEFLLWVGQQRVLTAKARAYAAEGQLSLAPVTDWLRSTHLHAPLRQLDAIWLTEVARILPELYTEQPDLPRYEAMTEYGQRQRFFEALARAILVSEQPLLLFIDDLQWCDQETLEWVHFLLRFDPKARLLIIGCVRKEELSSTHPLLTFLLHLRNAERLTEIALQPLDAEETAKLASKVAGQELDGETVIHLYDETRGHPLFVVELVRASLERGSTSSLEGGRFQKQLPSNEPQVLPPRVYAVLVGRLQPLSASARVFVEHAATIGCEFTLDLLIALGDGDAKSAMYALDELWQRRIVREHGVNSYDFTYDKLREVAYAEISLPKRRLLHCRVAQVLEALSSQDELDSVSGQIALHYERAGMIKQALPFYQRAAAAQRKHANEDATGLLSRDLELLELLPDGSKRDKQKLSRQLVLAPIYRVDDVGAEVCA